MNVEHALGFMVLLGLLGVIEMRHTPEIPINPCLPPLTVQGQLTTSDTVIDDQEYVESCSAACSSTSNETQRAFCETNCQGDMKQSTYSYCKFACYNTYLRVFKDKCDACMKKAPLTKYLCIHACENTHNKQLKNICKRCVNTRQVGEGLCMNACGRSFNNIWFQQICDKCFAPPLELTNSTCVSQCSNFKNSRFQNICQQCIQKPPCSPKMCMYACRYKFVHKRFRHLCEQCWFNLPILTSDMCIYACQSGRSNVQRSNRVGHYCKFRCTKNSYAPTTDKMCMDACRLGDNGYANNRIICARCADKTPITEDMCIYACLNKNSTMFRQPRLRQICEKCTNTPPLTQFMCMFACSNKVSSNAKLKRICDTCVASPLLSENLCIYSCSDTENAANKAICKACTAKPPVQSKGNEHAGKKPPLTEKICLDACSKNNKNICRKCAENPPITTIMCTHACSNTKHKLIEKICQKCEKAQPPPADLCINTCKTFIHFELRPIYENEWCKP